MRIKLPSGIVSPLAVLVLLGFCPDLNAQSTVVLRNVNVIDGTGSPAQPNRTVVIEDDHVQSIAAGQADTPSAAKTIDMRGQTIMPLIINTHGHLGMVKGTSSGVSNQTEDNFRHQLLRYQDYGIGAVLSTALMGRSSHKSVKPPELVSCREQMSTPPVTASTQRMAHRPRRWVSQIFCGPAPRKKRANR